jgi:hypothetical protein
MKTRNSLALVFVSAGLVAAGACGTANDAASFNASPGAGNGPSGGSGSGGGGSGTTTAGDAGTTPALPPETKTEGNYQSPVSTGEIVWIANPTSGLVAYVDAKSLIVQTVAAGDGPTYLAAVPDPNDDVAIVLNALSQDATLMRDHGGVITTQTFPATAQANAWSVSASGHWAIAWTNASLITTTPPPDPTQGFQNVAVLDLTASPPSSTILTVGYRPVQLAFSGDESHAFAVTQDGISVVDLVDGAQPAVTQNFPLAAPVTPASDDAGASAPDASSGAAGEDAASPSTGSTAPDVSFTPDGSYALIRNDGLANITIVTLADGTLTTVPLASVPTDLSISPTGTFALAVLRDSSTVVSLPIPGIVSDPTSFTSTVITGQTVGRAIVTAKGDTALLFTTAAPIDALSVLTFAPSPTFRVVPLHAPVLAVFPTGDGQNAIVLHQPPASGSTVKGAFSVVPIGTDLPALIVGVPAAPTAVALDPAGDRALISIRDDPSSTYGMYLAMMPSLDVLPYTLASPPIAVGIAAQASRGYVAQDYVEGRITFVDLDAGDVRTISGFDLGAGIVTGGAQ